jgi:hypothetical protein
MFDANRTAYANATTQRFEQYAHANVAPDDINARLNWLVAFHAYDDYRRRLFRNAREETDAQLMRRPFTTRQAYARLGLLLGALPPAAIFYRMFGRVLEEELSISFERGVGWLLLFVLMNLICCVVGRSMGAALGKYVDALERSSWSKMLLVVALLGFVWAIVAGAAGGLLFFGIGAIFGAALAVPVGSLGFVLFTSLHRLSARGGMIDARHFWPLACGVALVIAALILSPQLFPY